MALEYTTTSIGKKTLRRALRRLLSDHLHRASTEALSLYLFP
nr:MAG TPA: hypothetical protein [Caudoviricetes sp.]